MKCTIRYTILSLHADFTWIIYIIKDYLTNGNIFLINLIKIGTYVHTTVKHKDNSFILASFKMSIQVANWVFFKKSESRVHSTYYKFLETTRNIVIL